MERSERRLGAGIDAGDSARGSSFALSVATGGELLAEVA